MAIAGARPAGHGVIWDFDGTLAERPGRWSGCVLEVLDELGISRGLQRGDIARQLHSGFPWHSPHLPHHDLGTPDSWWRVVTEFLASACRELGYDGPTARHIASRVRERYTDGAIGWRVFRDSKAALDRLAAAGFSQVILSNHVPELAGIVEAMGLARYFQTVLTSAAIGYEKPHRQAYAIALDALHPIRSAWMIGDNPAADYLGPRQLGIASILVDRGDNRQDRQVRAVPGLLEAVDIVCAGAR